MDTNNFSRIPQCGSCPDLRGHKVIVGAKQLRKSLQKGNARYVFLADNADPAITDALEQMCRQNQIPFSRVATMAELGQVCGIEVGAAAAAIVD